MDEPFVLDPVAPMMSEKELLFLVLGAVAALMFFTGMVLVVNTPA